jgi:peroxiredoxin
MSTLAKLDAHLSAEIMAQLHPMMTGQLRPGAEQIWRPAASYDENMLGVGDNAPDFQLEDTFGRQKSLEDLIANKPALLAFYKVSCPVCQYTLPFLERLSKTDNMDVVAVSQDDLKATEKFRAEYGVTFTTLLDQSKSGYPASNAYGISYVPSLVLVQPDGQISLSSEGFSKRDLEAIGKLAGVEPFHPDERIPDFRAG